MTAVSLLSAPRPLALYLNPHGLRIVREILLGERSHKDLKHAFDWQNTPEGHAYWSAVRQADELSREARRKLEYAACMTGRQTEVAA